MDKQTVRDAIERLKEQGSCYVKTRDIAAVVDGDVTRGEKGHIGRILNRLADDRDDLELWTDNGNNSMTWYLKGDGV